MPTYAEIRRQELKHIEESLKDDRKMKRAIGGIYRDSAEDIQRHIDADIQRFAAREGVSMVEARKIISKTDVEAFQSKARRYVKEKNFTPQANAELRKFNVTMRTSRLELLQSRINLDTISLALEEERITERYISTVAMEEMKRQSGILNMSAPSQSQLKRLAKSVALSDVSGATFSDRIWANQHELRNNINQAIERALIQGQHPRNAAASIKRLVRDEYGMKKRAADRILVTEAARAQHISMTLALKDAGIDKYIWIAESDACPDCAELDGQIFDVDEAEYTVPRHPFCRCATSAYVPD